MNTDDNIPTKVSLESLILPCVIYATERRDVDTADIPEEFMQKMEGTVRIDL